MGPVWIKQLECLYSKGASGITRDLCYSKGGGMNPLALNVAPEKKAGTACTGLSGPQAAGHWWKMGGQTRELWQTQRLYARELWGREDPKGKQGQEGFPSESLAPPSCWAQFLPSKLLWPVLVHPRGPKHATTYLFPLKVDLQLHQGTRVQGHEPPASKQERPFV